MDGHTYFQLKSIFMSYDEQKATANTQPKLQLILERLKKLNDEQRDTMMQMETRLHSILSKKVPEKPQDMEKMDPVDATSALSFELDRMRFNTDLLHKLVAHIQEIV